MKKTFNLFFLAFLFCSFIAFGQTTVLHCGKLIDGVANAPVNEVTIIIEKNIIKDIKKGFLMPDEPGAKVINLRDKTVMPGLMDMHVHIEGETNPQQYLQRFTMNEVDIAYKALGLAEKTLKAGFTTVRDLGGSGVNIGLRDAINKGYVSGPRIFTAGKGIAITGGHGDPTNGAKRGLYDYPSPEVGVADGADECLKAVRQQYKNGSDWIKITATGGVLSVAKDGKRPQFNMDEIKAVVQTAADLGMSVAAHAHGDEGIRRAAEAGVASIEHGTMMTEATMDVLIKKGTYLVPTITAGKSASDSAKIKGYYPDVVAQKALEIGPLSQSTFGKAYKKGVKIAFGTDAGVFSHGKNAMEFIYMTEAGMPAMEAIKSATVNAADLLGVRQKLGSVEKGKIADIIAVGENPLENIKTMLNVKFVMKDGVVYKNE